MNVSFDEADLRPLIEHVVAATLERWRSDNQRIGERLAYSEADAAALLSVKRHVLRDARLRGEIHGVRVGKGIRYEHAELLRFLRRET